MMVSRGDEANRTCRTSGRAGDWGEASRAPRLTIGVISCNRLHYLRATLESARRCIQYPNIEWIVVDNASVEPELRDYLKSLPWIDHLILRDSRSPQTEHAKAMNEIVARATGEATLIWPEDVQFVVEGDWMADCIELLLEHPWLGGMGLNFMRRLTLKRCLTWRRWGDWREWLGEFKRFRGRVRCQMVLRSSRGFAARTLGWTTDGIVGSGIPSLTRTEIWRRLGDWKAAGSKDLTDSSGGGETEMLRRWRGSGMRLQRSILVRPVAADIVTDPTGCKAKVRADKRYGVYFAPPAGTFYYQIVKQADPARGGADNFPLAFENWVKPLGYSLPFDEKGNLLKSSINTAVVEPVG